MATRRERAEAALQGRMESAGVDFKERFDPNSTKDWCEIVKDLVAMANSGGGCLVFGMRDDGTASDWDREQILSLDPATVTDKVFKYTTRQFADFEIVGPSSGSLELAVIVVDEVRVPIVFTKPGTYSVRSGREKIAFAQGTVYFRHGAKSEPGTTDDLTELVERRLAEERDHLLANVRRVFQAPPGHGVVLVPSNANVDGDSIGPSTPLTSDPRVPVSRLMDPDSAYPFRQKEVLEEVNRRLNGRYTINSFDALCIRRIHKIDGTKPAFSEKRMYSSRQYSERFVDWLVEQFDADPKFFLKARQAYRARSDDPGSSMPAP